MEAFTAVKRIKMQFGSALLIIFCNPLRVEYPYKARGIKGNSGSSGQRIEIEENRAGTMGPY